MRIELRYSLLFVLAASFLVPSPASAAESDIQQNLVKEYKAAKNICKAIKKTIGESKDHKEIVRTSVELGHNACMVVKCAIDGKGEVEKVVAGAMEAGARPDVVTRCAVEAGAEEELLADILAGTSFSLSVCYFGVKEASFTDTDGIADPFPPGRGGAGSEGTISEFRF